VSAWRDLMGTVNTVFRIGLKKASLDAGGLTAPRTFTLPDLTGTVALVAGITTQVQYNNAGALAGAANVAVVAGDLNLVVSTPAAAPAGTVTVFSKLSGGRTMLAAMDSTGVDVTAQPFLAKNPAAIWMPSGNSTTVPGLFGYTPHTVVGTPTLRTVATTNFFTRLRRLGYVSAAVAGSFAEPRVAVAQVTIGVINGTGGFHKVVRFGCSDAATVSGARQFVGVSSNIAAATNVEPSTLTNSIGVGHGAADTNLKLYFGGSAAQTPIDLGVNFPVNTLSVDAYELMLYASSNTATVGWTVTRLNTGAVASGTLTAATAGLQLPLNTTLLSYHKSWRTNNASALAVGLDLISDYVETDN
jgi:hypothetical protein